MVSAEGSQVCVCSIGRERVVLQVMETEQDVLLVESAR